MGAEVKPKLQTDCVFLRLFDSLAHACMHINVVYIHLLLHI